jgi:hypothetical protein
MGCKGVDWIHVVQDRAQWWNYVNKVTNLFASVRGEKLLELVTD